jgi:anti-sigma B factor antagonist
MSITLNTRTAGDVTIMDVSGRIVLGEETGTLRREMREILEKGCMRILLNLSGVTYIDSSGVGELVAAYVSVRKEGGTMKLMCLPARLEELLLVTKLCVIFDILEGEDTAIHSFA